MNNDELTKAFVDAGFDTTEKVAALLSAASKMVSLRAIDLQLEALNQKRADAVKPFEDERTQLENQKRVLAASILAG